MPDNVLCSQATLDFQGSQQVLGSVASMVLLERTSTICEEDMQETHLNEDTVAQRIMALTKMPLTGRFGAGLLRH